MNDEEQKERLCVDDESSPEGRTADDEGDRGDEGREEVTVGVTVVGVRVDEVEGQER